MKDFFKKIRTETHLKIHEKYSFEKGLETVEEKIEFSKKQAIRESVDFFIDILEQYDKQRKD